MKNSNKNIPVFAVSGIKNSGKTTLIAQLLPILTEHGIKTAVIKHDGHDFDPDVPGTDTYRHFHAGAYGTAVFSASKYMVVKQAPHTSGEQLMEWFPEADLILLEGFKTHPCRKIELIRRGISAESICEGHNLAAIATDLAPEELKRTDAGIPLLDINNPREIAAYILKDTGILEDRRKIK